MSDTWYMLNKCLNKKKLKIRKIDIDLHFIMSMSMFLVGGFAWGSSDVQFAKWVFGVTVSYLSQGQITHGHALQCLQFQDQSWIQREESISESSVCILIKRCSSVYELFAHSVSLSDMETKENIYIKVFMHPPVPLKTSSRTYYRNICGLGQVRK